MSLYKKTYKKQIFLLYKKTYNKIFVSIIQGEILITRLLFYTNTIQYIVINKIISYVIYKNIT